MKFGIGFANTGPFGLPEHGVNLARAAEASGFESLWTVEHVVVPEGYESAYPYATSGRMPGTEEMPIPDPLIWLTYIAAATERIRLATGIVILPQRHPIYLAKEIATLDVLSKGRAVLGVGIGWLKEEFDALGVPFAERAARTDEICGALRTLWSAGPQPFEGRFYRWPAVHSNPKPVQPGGPPIVIGGHTKASARRAARIGNGWFPARFDRAESAPLIRELRDECARIGRDPAEVEITTVLARHDLDAVREAEDLGVGRLLIPPPAWDMDGVRKGLAKFADQVIAKA
jgi:probable F420-dependent oxidoreductase